LTIAGDQARLLSALQPTIHEHLKAANFSKWNRSPLPSGDLACRPIDLPFLYGEETSYDHLGFRTCSGQVVVGRVVAVEAVEAVNNTCSSE
jgi:hypothetical protein